MASQFSRIEDFALERYFARWEFAVELQLSASDVQALTLAELLALADDDARERWSSLALGYTDSLGLPALREAIAGLYTRIDPRQIVVLAGEEGIFLSMHALLAPGDRVVVVTPAYQSLHAIARSIGADVHDVPLRYENRWELDIDELARAVDRGTRMIVVNFPHSPTGSHVSSATQRQLVEIADAAGALLFWDEAYRALEYAPAAMLSPAADLSRNAVSLGVMSKSFAVPGLRMGWIATQDTTIVDRIARLKDYTTICNSAPSEVLALIALRNRDRVWDRSRRIVHDNLWVASDFMAQHADRLEWVAPRAGSVGFPRLVKGDADQLSQQLAERESVLLLPGSVFGTDRSYFRLGLGRQGFPTALERLARLL